MTEKSDRLFPSSAVMSVLEPLASIPKDMFDVLLNEVRSPIAFDASKERCEKLADRISIKAEQIGMLLNVLKALYSRLKSIEAIGGSRAPLLDDFVDEMAADEDYDNIENISIIKSRLLEILTVNNNIDSATKIERLKNGFIDSAVTFSTFVDLRPNFDDSNRDKIIGFVPMVQMRIQTNSKSDNNRNIVLQINQKTLFNLKKIISETEEKLNAIRKSNLELPLLGFEDHDDV